MQFVVNVSDLDTIKTANDYLRDQAGASLVPSWAAKYMDRRPGSGRQDPSRSRDRTSRGSASPPRKAASRDRDAKRARSPPPEDDAEQLELWGLQGLPAS